MSVQSPFYHLGEVDRTSTVTLFLWENDNSSSSTKCGKGHVALQTYIGAEREIIGDVRDLWGKRHVLNTAKGANGFYISFYPLSAKECHVAACREASKRDSEATFKLKGHFHKAETDVEGAAQERIKIIHIRTLNIPKVTYKIKDILNGNPEWSVLAAGANDHRYNCVQMVVDLLVAGGMNTTMPLMSQVMRGFCNKMFLICCVAKYAFEILNAGKKEKLKRAILPEYRIVSMAVSLFGIMSVFSVISLERPITPSLLGTFLLEGTQEKKMKSNGI